MNKVKVLIGIPMLGTVTAEFLKSILELRTPFDSQICLEVNSLTHVARNNLAYKALYGQYDYLVMIDSDMVFEPDSVTKLVNDLEQNKNAGLVGALAFRRHFPTAPVLAKKLTWSKDANTGVVHYTDEIYEDYPRNTLFSVAGCGFGMVCIRCSSIWDVTRKFATAPFDPMPQFGEDYSFCWRMGKLDMELLCDSSVLPGHVGTMVFTEREWLEQRAEREA